MSSSLSIDRSKRINFLGVLCTRTLPLFYCICIPAYSPGALPCGSSQVLGILRILHARRELVVSVASWKVGTGNVGLNVGSFNTVFTYY